MRAKTDQNNFYVLDRCGISECFSHFKEPYSQTKHTFFSLKRVSFNYVDCIKIINKRSDFIDCATGINADGQHIASPPTVLNLEEQAYFNSQVERSKKLRHTWDLFAYMIYATQQDDLVINRENWKCLGLEFGQSYLANVYPYALERLANFGLECRHKFVKRLVKASNHHFNYRLYRDTLIKCYLWTSSRSQEMKQQSTSKDVDLHTNHRWATSQVEKPSAIIINGISYVNYFNKRPSNVIVL
eukprot:gene12981-15262_t